MKKLSGKNENSKLKYIGLGLCIVILLVTMRMTSTGAGNIVTGGLREVLNPLVKPANSASIQIGSFFDGIFNYKAIQTENNLLKDQNAQLKAEVSTLQDQKAQNIELKNQLGFKNQGNGIKTVPGEVISRNTTNWFKSFVISKGSKDGIAVGNPVVTSRGFIGRVSSITKNTSEVILITDDKYGSIAVTSKETKYPGILKCNDIGKLEMTQIPENGLIQKGYHIVTSSLGDSKYEDLVIGEVTSVEKGIDGLTKTAVIEPYESISQVKYVTVLVN